MSKSSFYGIFFLVILFVFGFISASNAQTTNPATKVLVKTFAADTVDVTALKSNGNTVDVEVAFDDNVNNIQIVQIIEVVNSNKQNVLDRLTVAGYFDYKQWGMGCNLRVYAPSLYPLSLSPLLPPPTLPPPYTTPDLL
jgi:hypothetical protein